MALRPVSVQVIWFSPIRNIPSVAHKYSFFYQRGYTRIILPANNMVSFTFENLRVKNLFIFHIHGSVHRNSTLTH